MSKRFKTVIVNPNDFQFKEINAFCTEWYKKTKILAKNGFFEKCPQKYCAIINRETQTIVACIGIFTKNHALEFLPLETKNMIECAVPSIEIGRVAFNHYFLNSKSLEKIEKITSVITILLIKGARKTIAQIVKNVETLKGMQFFAHTHEKVVDFFENSNLFEENSFQIVKTTLRWNKIPEDEKDFYRKGFEPKVYRVNLLGLLLSWNTAFEKISKNKEIFFEKQLA